MRVLMPFANQLGARPQRGGGCGGQSARLIRAFRESTQPALYGKAQAAVSAFLNPVRDATDQQIAAQPGRRRHSIQPAPFDPEISDGQRVEGKDPGFDIGRIGVTTDRGTLAAGRLASFLASLVGLMNRLHAPASVTR